MAIREPKDCPYYLISRSTLAVTSRLKQKFVSAGLVGVRPSYLGVLMTLWRNDGPTSAELGRRAGLEPSTMTGLLDRMERDHLVVRAAVPGDRRAQRICLTDLGRRIREPVLRAMDMTLKEILEGVPEADLDRVKETLRRVLANTDKASMGST